MSDAASAAQVRDVPEESRYEARVGEALAAFARYTRRDGRTIFVHTETEDEFEGQGVASALIAGALDAERAAGRPIVPICPFVSAFVERHPEYGDLVDEQLLAQIGDA